MPPHPRRAPGERVGPYVLERQLGSGPFAEVWLAGHAHLVGRPADLKLYTDRLAVELLADAPPIPWYGGRKAFPALLDFAPLHDPPYVVTEHVEGCSLRQEIERCGRFEPRRAVELLGQIAGALKSAHHEGLLHLDLSSTNVLLAGGEELRVLDLGAGRFSVEAANRHRRRGKRLAPAIERALAYRTRRQKQGGETDERTDIFALGVLLFEMLTGQLPQGKQRPSQVAGRLPRWTDQLFTRCVTRLEKRFPDLLALEKEIKARKLLTQTGVRRRFQTMQILDRKTVLVSMKEIAADRDTVDAANIETIIKNIEYLAASGFGSIVLDFGEIQYVSSTGFGYLVNLADAIGGRGGQAIICAVQPKVRMILDVLGLARFFVLCESVEEAKARLAQ